MKKLRKLVIRREKWDGADTNGCGTLYSSDTKKMCCLGFYGRQCGGFTVKEIVDSSYLTNTVVLPSHMEWLNEYEGEPVTALSWERRLAQLNDAVAMKLKDKEREIAQIFREKGGVKVTFVGKAPRK